MKKALIIGAAIAGAALLAKRFAPKMQGIDLGVAHRGDAGHRPAERMFTNIKAIRDNSDRILELLEQERGRP